VKTDRTYICERCRRETDPVEVDDGGFEEAWGRPVWVPAFRTMSSCCRGAEAHTVQDWIDWKWTLPEWAQEEFA